MGSRAAHVTALLLAFLTAAFLAAPAAALEVKVMALFQGKAMLTIDGGKPRTFSAGETHDGVTLVSASSEGAVISIGGKRQRLRIGEGVYSALSVPSERATVTLTPDRNGHFVSSGSINGASVRFLVDTGATGVSMGVEDARRAGINYLAGTRGYSQTANGIVPIYMVKLTNVRLGDISLNDIDGVVHESAMPLVLLGMSFLKRLEMRREGESLTLIKKY